MLFPFSGILFFDEDLVSKPGIVIDAADPIFPYHRIFYQISLEISLKIAVVMNDGRWWEFWKSHVVWGHTDRWLLLFVDSAILVEALNIKNKYVMIGSQCYGNLLRCGTLLMIDNLWRFLYFSTVL